MLIFIWIGVVVALGHLIQNHWLLNSIITTPMAKDLLLEVCWLALFHGRAVQHRRLGKTIFANANNYLDVHLTDQHRKEYLRDGMTVVRNVFRPELLSAMRMELQAQFGITNSIWSHYRSFDSDALTDFYAYSNLGTLAAELFTAPGTTTEYDENPNVYVWRDFQYVRHPGVWLSSWHPDSEDCEFQLCPTHWLTCQRPRILIPLTDFYEGPVMVNQSHLADEFMAMSDQKHLSLSDYIVDSMEGRDQEGAIEWLRQRLESSPRIHESFDFESFTFTRQVPLGFVQYSTRLGDVVMHVPCALHTSPPPLNDFYEFSLYPTFAHGQSKVENPELYHRSCIRQHPEGVVDDNADCFLQVYPPAQRPVRGSSQTFRHWGNVFQWFGCALYDESERGLKQATNMGTCKRKGF